MLVLSRRKNEVILIGLPDGRTVRVQVVCIHGDKVRLGMPPRWTARSAVWRWSSGWPPAIRPGFAGPSCTGRAGKNPLPAPPAKVRRERAPTEIPTGSTPERIIR